MKRNSTSILIFVLFLSLAGCQPAAVPPSRTSPPDAGQAAQAVKTPPAPSALAGPLIFDDDGSPDGTTALLYLLSRPDVSLIGVSISYGEAYPDVYIQHIGRVLDRFGIRDMPLGAGKSAPLGGDNAFPEPMREGANEFWGLPVPNAEKTYPVQGAAEMMVSLVRQSAQPVTVFLSGPCTNLAQALRLDPSIKEKIAAVYIMGGAVYAPGNIRGLLPEEKNRVAEWNIYADPTAASEVFSSGLNLYLVPLDATDPVRVGRKDLVQWRKGGPTAQLAADFYETIMRNWATDRAQIWDVMTAAVMVDPGLCEFQPLHLDVITDGGDRDGQTVAASGAAANVQACLKADADQVLQTLNTVFAGSAAITPAVPTVTVPTAPVPTTPPETATPAPVSDAEEATPAPPTPEAATATPENLLFRDDFSGELQPGWRWEFEEPQRHAFTPQGWLLIQGEDHALLYHQGQSNLLWRDLPVGDFAVTVHLRANPTVNYQQATIYLYDTMANYVAINRGFCSSCLRSGNGVYMEYKFTDRFGAYKAVYEGIDLYLRLENKDQVISGYYAEDPDHWERLGRFGNYFDFGRIGLGVSNVDAEGDDPETLTGMFDYFEITRP